MNDHRPYLDTPPRPALRRATTEPPPDLSLQARAEMEALEPPPSPCDGMPAWAISEKNTFLSVKVPEQPSLFRSRTDPSKCYAMEEVSDSDAEVEPAVVHPMEPQVGLEFLETQDRPTLLGLEEPHQDLDAPPGLPPPPFLSLEYVETDDPFRGTPAASERLGLLTPPPLLSLEYVATDDPFRPTPTTCDALLLAAPPQLSLEYVATDDPFFRATPSGAGYMPLTEYVETDNPFQSVHQDIAWPQGLQLCPPPPPIALESFDTEDPFENPLQLLSLQASEPAFVTLPSRPVVCGPPPPPMAPAPLIGTYMPMPPPPPPAQMPSMPAPDFAAPSAHDVPMAQPGHTPGAGISSLLASDLRQPGLVVRPSVAGCTHVLWSVDARKLEGQDKQAVSQVFLVELPECGPTPFKLVLYPKATNDGKHGAGFKKAKGHGRVVLKCEAQLPESMSDVCFRLGLGRAGKGSETLQAFRGPVMENFFEHSCHGLPKSEENWDFPASVEDSRTFLVTLEIAPTSAVHANPGLWWEPLQEPPAP